MIDKTKKVCSRYGGPGSGGPQERGDRGAADPDHLHHGLHVGRGDSSRRDGGDVWCLLWLVSRCFVCRSILVLVAVPGGHVWPQCSFPRVKTFSWCIVRFERCGEGGLESRDYNRGGCGEVVDCMTAYRVRSRGLGSPGRVH